MGLEIEMGARNDWGEDDVQIMCRLWCWGCWETGERMMGNKLLTDQCSRLQNSLERERGGAALFQPWPRRLRSWKEMECG
jgi:hypothetical protein